MYRLSVSMPPLLSAIALTLFATANVLSTVANESSLPLEVNTDTAAPKQLQLDPLVLAACPSLRDWLHADERWHPRGYHVVCVMHGRLSASQWRHVTLWAFPGGVGAGQRTLLPRVRSVLELRQRLSRLLRLKPQPRWLQGFPWRIFDHEGSEVTSLSAMKRGAIWLIFEGGEWMWPGVSIGFERHIRLDPGGPQLVMRTVALDPVAFTIEEFAKEPTMAKIVQRAQPKLEQSAIQIEDGEELDDGRSSSQAWLDAEDDVEIARLNNRSHALVRSWWEIESLQVLRYQVGQQYQAHIDSFHQWDHLRDHKFLSTLTHRRNRFATLFVYLSHVASGGETGFPRAHGSSHEEDSTACSSWFAVKPKPGLALLFYSLHPDATPNVASKHAGCPVHSGIKWAATMWFYNGHRRKLPLEDDIEIMPLLRGVEVLEKHDGIECADASEECDAWAEEGRCLDSSGDFAMKCMESCGICLPTEDDDVTDDSEDEVLQDEDAGDHYEDDLNGDELDEGKFIDDKSIDQNEDIQGIEDEDAGDHYEDGLNDDELDEGKFDNDKRNRQNADIRGSNVELGRVEL